MLYCHDASVTIICRLIVSKWEIRFQVIIGYATLVLLNSASLSVVAGASKSRIRTCNPSWNLLKVFAPGVGNNYLHHIGVKDGARRILTGRCLRLRDGRRRAAPASPADRRPALPSARRRHGNHLVIKASPYHNHASHLWWPHTCIAQARFVKYYKFLFAIIDKKHIANHLAFTLSPTIPIWIHFSICHFHSDTVIHNPSFNSRSTNRCTSFVPATF